MEKRRLLMDVLSNLVAFVVLFNAFFVFYAGVHGVMNWWFLLLALPFFSMLLLRRLVNDIGIFLLIHVVYIIPPIFVFNDLTTTLTVTGFAAFSVIYSVLMRAKDEHKMRFRTAALAILMILTAFFAMNGIMAVIGPVPGVAQFTGISALVVLLAVVMFVQMDNLHFDLSLLKVRSGANQTEKKVFDVNNALIISFTVFMTIFAVVAMFVPGGRVLSALWRPVGFVIYQIWRLFVFLASLIIPEITPVAEEDRFAELPYLYEDDQQPEEEQPAALVFIIMGIFTAAGVAAGIIIAIVMILRTLIERRQNRNKQEDDSEQPADNISRLKFAISDLAAFLPRFRFGAKHPIRKAYIKKVNSHIRQGVVIMPSNTPEIIADRIRHRENIDELTEAYEGVRYGRSK